MRSPRAELSSTMEQCRTDKTRISPDPPWKGGLAVSSTNRGSGEPHSHGTQILKRYMKEVAGLSVNRGRNSSRKNDFALFEGYVESRKPVGQPSDGGCRVTPHCSPRTRTHNFTVFLKDHAYEAKIKLFDRHEATSQDKPRARCIIRNRVGKFDLPVSNSAVHDLDRRHNTLGCPKHISYGQSWTLECALQHKCNLPFHLRQEK